MGRCSGKNDVSFQEAHKFSHSFQQTNPNSCSCELLKCYGRAQFLAVLGVSKVECLAFGQILNANMTLTRRGSVQQSAHLMVRTL